MATVTPPAHLTGRKQGKLTIFASYFLGTGKSYAMLEMAVQARQAGLDVVIGLLSCEQWPQTKLLAETFEALPRKTAVRDGQTDYGLDLDACLKRAPELILVDDLSHINVDDSRHMKRYQDIEELLKAGVDVYTTLNVQHIESIQDAIYSILGSSASERIPDRVFDQATQVEYIDIEPERLQQRLLQQKKGELLSGCTLSQLSALREIGLRRCADRAASYSQGPQSRMEYRTREHILACLSSAPSNEKIIRTAARMASAFRCGFTALFVETKEFQWMSPTDKERLQANIHLAQQLGASIETVYGDDVAYQIAEFSRLSGVTKIVLGRSGIPHRMLIRKPSLTERLIELIPELDIHIIPDNGSNGRLAAKHREIMRLPTLSILDLLKSALLLILATLIGFLFYHFGFTEANIITLYILGVMLVSISTKSSVCSFIASFVSVLTFNFFFTEPRFSLHAYDSGYPVTFLVMFLASLLTGSLASKLKSHAKRSAQVAWRTKLLLETNQNLQKARTQEEIISVTAKQLLKIFQRDIVAYRIIEEKPVTPEIFLTDSASSPDRYTSDKEREVAQWVITNNKRAGAGTENLSDSCCTYLSIRTGKQIYGVVGIAASDKPLDSFETSILLSVLGESALALENQKNLEEKEAAAVWAKNEQLRANLLRSISHDLRTPLTSISGNASNLLSNGDLFDAETKKQMYTDIYDDAMWLINLVENLLSVSRLEEGRMNLHVSTELIDEVVAEALRHINRKSAAYRLKIQNNEEYVLAQIDAKLIVQVIINIVDNAIKYTPAGSEISIGWKREGNYIYISIADNGPGISDQAKPHIFDMFYSASNQIADSRRSMGLGLALCKSIVNAHGGEIMVTDHLPHGSIFTFSVPAGEVELHE
ncbi:DUF4118 domain-containing protein [Pseudoflavonifractor phocaeensis]|uniref:DUF4118 domain-containing protein n=1 Tax=Pseudoflavonifractor phocaeensis TaxID=1870988 RepID=UPI001958DD05|nr:sensor histidine kinase KdpD [Pseudoflavonifractor phocaeensis]